MEANTGPLKDTAVSMTVYLRPDDHKRLRILAAVEDTSIQSLLMDGLDTVLRQRGEAPVSRWAPRRKQR